MGTCLGRMVPGISAMRIIKFFVLAFVAITVSASLLFLITREALLAYSTWQVKDSLLTLRTAAGNPARFVEDCKKYATTPNQVITVKSIEMTFTSNRDYQFQVICDNYMYQPIVKQKFELGPFVTKVPGSAGFVWSETVPTVAAFTLWGRTQSVVFGPQETQIVQGKASLDSTLFPQASCQAYGFQCCGLDSTQGVGEQAVAATDCPKTCFSQCVARPVVLSLNTQPFYEPKTRSVHVTQGQEVTFSYSTSLPADQTKSVVLSFGDTRTYESASPSGRVSHEYRCQQTTCEYQAVLTVTDKAGLTNVSNDVSKVKVIVGP